MKQYDIRVGRTVPIYESQEGCFDKCLAEIHSVAGADVDIMSAEQLAWARMLAGPKHAVSENGSWTSEGYVRYSDGALVIAKAGDNPIMKQPTAVANAHRAGEEFYLEKTEADALRQRATLDVGDALKSGLLLVENGKIKGSYTPESFGDDDVPRFVFGSAASEYGAWLKEQEIRDVPHYVAAAAVDKSSFVRAFWLGSLAGRSSLNGDGRLDYCDGRVFGVQRNAVHFLYEKSSEDFSVRRGECFGEVPAKQAAPDSKLEHIVKAL